MEQDGAGRTATPGLHALPPPPRDSAGTPVPARAAASPELRALLAHLDDLRLVLSADLGLAASAVDAGAYDVARDVLAGAQDDVAVFALRAGHAVRGPAAGVPPVLRRPRRRLSVLAPGLTAAAALVGVLLGVAPASTPQQASERSVTTTAAASYAELWRLHEQGAPAPRLARAARQLHSQLGRLVVEGAPPEAVSEALRLLELQQRVLSEPRHREALQAELAATERLVAALRAAALGSPAGPALAGDAGPDVVPRPTAGATAPTQASGGTPAAGGALAPPAPTAGEPQEPAPAPRPVGGPAPAPDGGSAGTAGSSSPARPQTTTAPEPTSAPATGSTSDGSTSDGSTSDGSTTDGSTTDGSTSDGSAPERSTSSGGSAESDAPAQPDATDEGQVPAAETGLSPRSAGTLLPD